MAGGTFTTQNKVRPGVYINFASAAGSLGSVGNRGTVTLPLSLPWGEAKKILTIQAGDDVTKVLGYELSAPQLVLVREALKHAGTLLLYRLNTGVKAAITAGTLTATAKFGGTKGNAVKIVIEANLDDSEKFDVQTYVDGKLADKQTVATIADLAANDWVAFGGTGDLAVTAGAALTGGLDGTVVNQDYVDYLSAIELHDFQTIALPSTDTTLKSLFVSFVKRLRDVEGRKIQAVLENYPAADAEGIISVKNGVQLTDGRVLTPAQATAWVAGATAMAGANQSLTYTAYDDAADAVPRLTNSQTELALKNGEWVFTSLNGQAVVEQDINTFKSYTPEKGKAFSKNRTLRVLDGLANDWKKIYEAYYIGKVDNNDDGRSLFRNECVKLAEQYQNMGALQNLKAADDIRVFPGAEADSVAVEAALQPVDAIEKIYMKVQVK
ncbi:phage tail sheath family protein [Gorillibacterium timonense]|uniref:phage tail sheath family protein n=1 Tax=Gorillibacterium timonense TaxID=1689269 RepID=UPI00071DAB57|nr:phage tail sheath family protein [Gorillibacterium timonense]